MNLRFATTLALLVAGASGAPAADPAAAPYKDHSRLLVYLDSAGQEHAVRSSRDWLVRRAHVLAGMQAAMGALPDRSNLPPLDLQVVEQTQQEGLERLTVSLVAEAEDRLTAYLYLPRGSNDGQRRAAMLALHPTGPLGKGIIAGLAHDSGRAYALELAQRGYVVLAPDYPSFGDLAGYDFQADHYVSGTMKGIFNHMRCVDLLQSRDEVDPQRIGVIGHSLGGHNAIFVGAFDERLQVIVSSCGWTPFHHYYGGKLAGWTSDRYMPRIRDEYGLDPDRVPFDFYEVVAALSPRAFFSNSPLEDSNFDVEGVRKTEPLCRAVYELLGAGDNLQFRYPDCRHDFPPAVREEAYRFIDRVLTHTPDPHAPPLE